MIGDTGIEVLKLLTGGLCGILTIIDWFTISRKAKQVKFSKDKSYCLNQLLITTKKIYNNNYRNCYISFLQIKNKNLLNLQYFSCSMCLDKINPRSIVFLLHGDIFSSLKYNLLGSPIVILLIAYLSIVFYEFI